MSSLPTGTSTPVSTEIPVQLIPLEPIKKAIANLIRSFEAEDFSDPPTPAQQEFINWVGERVKLCELIFDMTIFRQPSIAHVTAKGPTEDLSMPQKADNVGLRRSKRNSTTPAKPKADNVGLRRSKRNSTTPAKPKADNVGLRRSKRNSTTPAKPKAKKHTAPDPATNDNSACFCYLDLLSKNARKKGVMERTSEGLWGPLGGTLKGLYDRYYSCPDEGAGYKRVEPGGARCGGWGELRLLHSRGASISDRPFSTIRRGAVLLPPDVVCYTQMWCRGFSLLTADGLAPIKGVPDDCLVHASVEEMWGRAGWWLKRGWGSGVEAGEGVGVVFDTELL
ncbi:hypothetical protein Tco_1092112 [Tanacetum coccineum]|uniref:Uncharacterized protein n=1 Tax=Tanacetum coccineum TaxID=301880 RepID=A0ABQ5I8X8_9ASTR